QLSLEELPGGRIRIENLSATTKIVLADGSGIGMGTCREMDLPVSLTVGQTRIEIGVGALDAIDQEPVLTICQPFYVSVRTPRLQTLSDLGESPAPEPLAHWMETVITLQRSAAGAAEFHAEAARALVDLIGFDLGMVVLRRGTIWEVTAQYTIDSAGEAHF